MSTPEHTPDVFEMPEQPSFPEAEATAIEPRTALFVAWQESAIDQANAEQDFRLQRDRLARIVADAMSASDNETTRANIQHFGEVTDYFWFGDEQTSFPEALMKASLDGLADPILTLDPRILDLREYSMLGKRLEPFGLDALIAHREEALAQQVDSRLLPLARSIAADTPAYRLLESFVGRPLWQERPLTTAERMLEEQSVERQARTRYGLDAGTPLRHHHAVWREVARGIQGLDESTRFDYTTTPQDTPTLRAKNMFMELARATFEGPGSMDYFGRIQRVETLEREEQDPTMYVSCELQDTLWDPASFFSIATSLQYMNTPDSQVACNISESLLADVAVRLFAKDGDEMPYEQILEQALAERAAQLTKDLTDFATLTHHPLTFRYCATALVAPQEATFDAGAGIVLVPYESRETPRSQNVLSRREYAEAAKERVATVGKRPAYDTDSRLLHFCSAYAELPCLPEDDLDLTMTLDAWSDRLDITVQGYELVSRDPDAKTFGYRYTPEADPYTECLVEVPVDAQQQLAQEYLSIGLVELAARVGAATTLTVAELTTAIQETNRYTLPKERGAQTVPQNLADYVGLVDDGRLAMQCTHASRFLSLSLQHIFGKGSAHSLNGLLMGPTTNRISRLGHAQTVFIDPNSHGLYVLDATPSQGDSIRIWRDMLSGRRSASALSRVGMRRAVAPVEQSARAPQAVQGDDMVPRLPEHTPEERALQREQRLTKATYDFTLQLRMLFGKDGQPIPEETLRERAAALPSQDVLFRTMSALTRNDLAELQAVRSFALALQSCNDPSILRAVDPRGYVRQPLLLPTIERNIRALLRLAGEQDSTQADLFV